MSSDIQLQPEKKTDTVGLLPLIGLVVGSMIGSGVFNLMHDMSVGPDEANPGTSVMAVVIAWVITGVGMATLVLCFYNLNRKRPDLDAGIYAYAREGFGRFMGFNSAWGYWISAFLGNVAYATLLFTSLGYFIKVFGDGQNVASVIGASVMLWFVTFLVLRGVRSSSIINAVVTAAKLVPLAVFLVAGIAAFKLNVFSSDVWGAAMQNGSVDFGALMAQVRSTMLVTVWIFIGIEGAVVFSGRARKKSDIGKATILGFLTVLAIYILVTVLSLGIMTSPELGALDKPAMAQVLEYVVGPWGAGLVRIGVIISVAGAWLAWTMFAAELPYQAAKEKTFPKVFGRENKKKAPSVALIVTSALVQVFLLTFLVSDSAYNFAFSLAASAILIPYAFTAFYQLKYSLSEPAGTKGKALNVVIGVVASVYALWLIYAGGLDFLLLTMLLYGPGIIVYWYMQVKENNERRVFTTWETVAAVVIAIMFVVGVIQLATGAISI